MYAVIKSGGKQYRVSPGDLLVVEKLAGEPGESVAFDQVLMVGEGADVTVGAPLVAGAKVDATLIETRKGDKVKIFKKIRRQGYRRTRGHRQTESVFRVTAVTSNGKSATWDGEVSLVPLAELTLRARNLARTAAERLAATIPPDVEIETVVEPKGRGKAARVSARVVEGAEPLVTEPSGDAAEAKAAAPKKARAKGPSVKDVAKSSAPKPTKSRARAPAVRKTSPRGKG